MMIHVTLNGKKRQFDVEPSEFLADTLRKNGCLSVKIGCNDGACGTCSVLIDDKPFCSCEYLSARADGKNIKTVEGLGAEADKIVDCLVRVGGEGCGYCAPAFVIMTYALKKEYPKAGFDEVKAYLNGNLCRCTGYVVRVEAALAYLAMD